MLRLYANAIGAYAPGVAPLAPPNPGERKEEPSATTRFIGQVWISSLDV